MRIKETKVYTYAELSEDAKATARDWYREASAGDTFWSESVTEDFHETLKAFGFDPYVSSSAYQRETGFKRRSTVQWSGFSSQGDGASFSGTWRAADFKPDALLENRPEVSATPNGENAKHADNVELHRIASELRACVDAGLTFFRFDSHTREFYMTMDSAEHEQPESFADSDAEDAYVAVCAANEDRFIEAARDLAHAFYKALEAEYEYQNSDEQIAESIEANEYEFTAEGVRAC